MKRLDFLSLVTRSSLLMIARVAGGVVSVAGSILIARYFGADALGSVALSLAAMNLIALAACAGRQAVAPLFVSEYLVHERTTLIRGFIETGWKVIARVSLCAISLVAAAAWLFGNAAAGQLAGVLVFSCLAAPALALINFNGAVLTGYRRQLLGLVPDLLLKPLLVLLAIIGVAALAPPGSVYVLLGGICVALWVTAGLQAYFIRRRGLFPAQPADLGDAARWYRKATPWIAIILLSDYLVELHLLLAGWILAPALVGILHICFRLRMLASFGMRALYAVILPDIYAAHARGDAAGLARDITRGNALVLAYASAACVTVAIFGDRILALFGDEFAPGYGPLVICCLSMIPRAVFGPATSIMAAAGRQKPMIIILLAGVLLSALTVMLTFSLLGLQSIAAGYAAAIAFASVAQWWWTWRETGIDCSIFAMWSHRRGAVRGLVPARRSAAF